MANTPTIFLSYSWANRDIADEIDKDFQITGITLRRDIRDVKYHQSIKDFMKSITTHDYVLVLISNEFIRSANCMYEVMELLQEPKYKEKILPVILDESQIFQPAHRIEIIKFWADKKKETEKLLKTIDDVTRAQSVQEDLKHYKNISENLDSFLEYIKNTNSKSLQELKKEGYKSIFELVGYNSEYRPYVREKNTTSKKSLFISFDETISSSDAVEMLLLLNSLYKSLGGDELLIDDKGSSVYSLTNEFKHV